MTMFHLTPALTFVLLAGTPPQDTGITLPGADPRQEIRRLFQEVEQALSAIDLRLADAGAGEVPLDEVDGSGIEKLLRDSQQGSREAISKMDRILELAMQMGGRPSGGSGSDQPSPLDQPRDGTPLDRESTPEAPTGKEPGSPEEPAAPQPGQEKPQDPGSSEEPGENQPGDKPPGGSGEPGARPEDSDPWGFLPQRAREVFRNQGNSDMPVQYRDWIDSYYRRLNATRP